MRMVLTALPELVVGAAELRLPAGDPGLHRGQPGHRPAAAGAVVGEAVLGEHLAQPRDVVLVDPFAERGEHVGDGEAVPRLRELSRSLGIVHGDPSARRPCPEAS